jgi:MFS family permease
MTLAPDSLGAPTAAGTAAQTAVQAGGVPVTQGGFYRRYLLAMLMLVLAFSYVDRAVFSVVQQEIETDLHLSDSQLGILNGIGFALFFAAMGIPLARWADRGNRIAIIVLTASLWSVSVALCGAVSAFAPLLLLRIATAVGESGCGPTANSLIPDYFSRGALPRAVGFYMLGGPLGTAAGYFAAGGLNQAFGWRGTFVSVGIPGLVLAVLAAVTLHDPRSKPERPLARTGDGAPAEAALGGSFKEVATLLMSHVTLRKLWLCYVVWYFCGWALQQWLPTFFIRSHGIGTKEVGAWFALACIVGGVLGSWLGGELSSRFAHRNERLQLQGAAAAFVFLAVCFGATLLVANVNVAFVALTLALLGASMIYAPLIATIQTLVPARMRATMLALGTLLPTFVGMGLGPSVTGAVSDALRPFAGEESLRYALLLICPGFLLAAWYVWRASRTVMASI